MALQTSGAISLLDVQNEFGGSNPIGMNEYYGATSGIPTSGAIGLNAFYGKSSFNALPNHSVVFKSTITTQVDGKLTYYRQDLASGGTVPTNYGNLTYQYSSFSNQAGTSTVVPQNFSVNATYFNNVPKTFIRTNTYWNSVGNFWQYYDWYSMELSVFGYTKLTYNGVTKTLRPLNANRIPQPDVGWSFASGFGILRLRNSGNSNVFYYVTLLSGNIGDGSGLIPDNPVSARQFNYAQNINSKGKTLLFHN